jgi:hypothetical protein
MTEIEALALSAFIEAPVAWLAARGAGWAGRGPGNVAGAAAVATAATHPLLWAAALFLYPLAPYWLVVAGLEALVVVAEGALIAWMAGPRLHQAMLISLFANAVSLLVGLLLTA